MKRPTTCFYEKQENFKFWCPQSDSNWPPADYKSEFGKGYAVKKGQKLITVRDIITSPTAEQVETAKLKN